jgi:hypothetical protein
MYSLFAVSNLYIRVRAPDRSTRRSACSMRGVNTDVANALDGRREQGKGEQYWSMTRLRPAPEDEYLCSAFCASRCAQPFNASLRSFRAPLRRNSGGGSCKVLTKQCWPLLKDQLENRSILCPWVDWVETPGRLAIFAIAAVGQLQNNRFNGIFRPNTLDLCWTYPVPALGSRTMSLSSL